MKRQRSPSLCCTCTTTTATRPTISYRILLLFLALFAMFPSAVLSFTQSSIRLCNQEKFLMRVSMTTTTIAAPETVAVGPRIPINENFPGLKKVYSNPDIFVINNFLDDPYCNDLIDKALEKKLERSPVAYAGWTDDFKDLVEISSKGPVAWISLVSAWFQVKDSGGSQLDLVVHSLQNYAIVFVLVTALIGLFTYSRAEGLKSLRTSTSTTIDDLSNPSSGAREFVRQSAKLFYYPGDDDDDDDITSPQSSILQQEAALFEAPTVIKYEKDQILGKKIVYCIMNDAYVMIK